MECLDETHEVTAPNLAGELSFHTATDDMPEANDVRRMLWWQELQVDLARQQRLQQNVLLLEQAYGEEKRRRAEQERLAPPTENRESQSLPGPSETEPIDTPPSHTVPGTSDPSSKSEDRPGSQDPQARGRHAGFRDLKEVPQDAEADRKRREMRKCECPASDIRNVCVLS